MKRVCFAGWLALLAACTSEAALGSWRAAPLGQDDASMAMPIDPPRPPPADGGAFDASGPVVSDGGSLHANPLCLRNPSLDGFTHGGPLEPGTWLPADSWDWCFIEAADFPDPAMVSTQISAVTVVNGATTVDAKDGMPAVAGALLPPTHGVGYLHLDTLRGMPERTSQQMCVILQADVTYNFAIDLASRIGQSYEGEVLNTGVLEIYGGDLPCGHAGEPLWRSPPLTSNWQTYCVSITPSEPFSVMTLQMPAKDRPKSAILVDNIRLSDECGPAVVTAR